MRTMLPVAIVFLALAGCGGSKATPGLTDAIVEVPQDEDALTTDAPVPEDGADRDVTPDPGATDDVPVVDLPTADVPTQDTPEDVAADVVDTDLPTDPGAVDPGPPPVEYPPSARGQYQTSRPPGT